MGSGVSYNQVTDVTIKNYVAFDTTNCGNSCIQGFVTMMTDGYPINMSSQYRGTIPPKLVAWTAANPADTVNGKNSGQISWEHLTIMGFGYGLYQGDQTNLSFKVFPYTRSNIGVLYIDRCLVPFESGKAGNGFDDMSINILRCTRCGKEAVIRNTDIHVNSVFFDGLAHYGDSTHTGDAESFTVSYSGSGNDITIYSGTITASLNDIIAIENAGLNIASGSIYHVSLITHVGTTLTLETPPDIAFTNQRVYLNPPSLNLTLGGKLTSQHYYMEELYDRGMEIQGNGGFICSDFKISGGETGGTFACRTGYPIISTDLNCSVNINLHPKALNNHWLKGLVGFGRITDPSHVSASIACKITAQNNFKDWVNCYLFAGINLPDSILGSNLRDPWTNNSYQDINAYVDCADARYVFSGLNNSIIFKNNHSVKTGISVPYSTASTPWITILSRSDILGPVPGVILVTVKRSSGVTNFLWATVIVVSNNSSFETFAKIAGSTSPTATFQIVSVPGSSFGDLQVQTSGSSAIVCDVEYIRIG